MTAQTINSAEGLQSFIGDLRSLWDKHKYLRVSIKTGKDRSLPQNAITHAWYSQIARELREDDAAGHKRFCKLHFAIPILIAEDEEILALTLKKTLERLWPELTLCGIAENGIEAVNQALKEFPDIIFLDLNMPNIDGWQFLDEVQKHSFIEKLNIYIVSSSIDNHEIERAKRYKSVKNFISKPISLDFFEKYELLN